MALALSETRSGETIPILRPSLYQEWANMIILSREMHQLVSEGRLELFHSDVATDSGWEFAERIDDFWKTPIHFAEVIIDLTTDNETRIDIDYEAGLWEAQRSALAASITPAIDQAKEELLDWDAYIKTPPPPRQSGTLKVRFKYVGRSKPIPIDDPWA